MQQPDLQQQVSQQAPQQPKQEIDHYKVIGLGHALVKAGEILGLTPRIENLVGHIPLTDGELPLSYLEDAARKFGLFTKVTRQKLSAVSPLSTPIIVFDQAGHAIVVTKIDRKTRSVEVNEHDGAGFITIEYKLKDLVKRIQPFVIYTAKSREEFDEVSDKPIKDDGHWFWSAAKRFKSNYLQVLLAGLFVNILAIASPLFVMNVYDRVIPNLTIPTLWALTAGVLIAIFFDFILKLLRSEVVDQTGRRIDMAVSGRMLDKLLETQSDARPTSTGVIASHIRDFDNVRDVLTSTAVIAMTDAVFIFIMFYVLYIIVGPLVMVPAVAAIIILTATFAVQVPLARSMRNAQSDSSKRHGILVETLLSFDTIKSLGGGGQLRKRFDHSVAEASKSATQSRFWSSLSATFIQSVSQLVSVMIIVWGVFLVIGGDITVGALIAANILSGRVLAPLASVAGTLSRIQQARYAYKSVDRLMKLPSEWNGATASKLLSEPNIEFTNVSFSYPETNNPALRDISFSLKAGERLGIIGRVGSGKSTLGRLLNALSLPEDGKILIDGVDTRQIPPSELRSFVGVVPQTPVLISGTLHENLLLGAPMASPKDIEYAVVMSGLNVLVAEHELGLSMKISERGASLSGGQLHSVALAQALIRRPRVLFLDEPTAAIDPSSEMALLKNLKTICDQDNITLILATHRHNTLGIVDKLMVMEAGQIAAFGPKDQVMSNLQQRAKDNIKATEPHMTNTKSQDDQ